jgi:DNA (cytosine-5)-methyltransferase 1
VESLAPVAVLIENVPDVLNYGGFNIFETIAGALEDLGYECRYSLLNASHYGVPQMRTRCFLIAIAKCVEVEPGMPQATHHHVLPVGYRGTKDVALRHISIFEKSHYIETVSQLGLTPAVTAEEAIGDLPPITGHLEGKLKKAACRFNHRIRLAPRRGVPRYAKIMRNWPGFESDGYVCDHVTRCLPRDYKIFRAMKPGDQYPEAHAIACEMFRQELLSVERERGSSLSEKSSEYRDLLATYVPPYDPGKFPNKWRKMEADQPARTLTAHIGKDTYSHIHYDSEQARTISVREAARLQSFPDGFKFAGTMNPAFRQIGNAVPPLLAFAVLSQMVHDLGGRMPNSMMDMSERGNDPQESIHEPIASSY